VRRTSPLGANARRNKTMPAISSKNRPGVRLRRWPQPAVSLGPRLRRRNCGVSQDSGGILTRNKRVGPYRRTPSSREGGPGTTRSKRTIVSIGAFAPSKIHTRSCDFEPVFSCLQTTRESRNRFRPDLLRSINASTRHDLLAGFAGTRLAYWVNKLCCGWRGAQAYGS